MPYGLSKQEWGGAENECWDSFWKTDMDRSRCDSKHAHANGAVGFAAICERNSSDESGFAVAVVELWFGSFCRRLSCHSGAGEKVVRFHAWDDGVCPCVAAGAMQRVQDRLRVQRPWYHRGGWHRDAGGFYGLQREEEKKAQQKRKETFGESITTVT